MRDAVLPSPPAREARRAVLRRRLRASVWPVAIWIPICVVAGVLREIRAVPHELAVALPLASLGAMAIAISLYRRSARARARADHDRESYLAELRAAVPALTPSERDRELQAVREMGWDAAAVEEVRELLESASGGTRPLPALRLRDPDAWFGANRLVKLRALVGYPAVGLLCAGAVMGIASLGAEVIEPIGVMTLLVPGVLTWRDKGLADAPPGERTAWSLAATFMFLVWLVAGLLAFAPQPYAGTLSP